MSPSLDRVFGVFVRSTTLRDIARLAASDLARELLVAIAQRPCFVRRLADDIGIDPPTVSRCLRSLRSAGLLIYRQEGHQHVYSPGPRLAIAQRGGTLVLTLAAESGARLILEFSEAELRDLRRAAQPPARPGAGPAAPLRVVVKPGSVPAPPGGARTVPRPPSGPG